MRDRQGNRPPEETFEGLQLCPWYLEKFSRTQFATPDDLADKIASSQGTSILNKFNKKIKKLRGIRVLKPVDGLSLFEASLLHEVSNMHTKTYSASYMKISEFTKI